MFLVIQFCSKEEAEDFEGDLNAAMLLDVEFSKTEEKKFTCS